MPQHRTDELWLTNEAFPQGRLLESYYDRDVTRLSDRGLASNMIGDRWSDICAGVVEAWPGTSVSLPDGPLNTIDTSYRLDAMPGIARVASKRGLQNPDFLVHGVVADEEVLVSLDAKFSIDTAKSSQVSAEVLGALLDVGPAITDQLQPISANLKIRDGYFLSPDMPLTHYVLELRRGRLAARVPASRVVLLPVSPVMFIKPMQGARLIGSLATMDGMRQEIRTNMLLAMYYFRLARACYGAYIESTTPLIGRSSDRTIDDADLESITLEIARSVRTSWQVVMHWDARAEQVKRQRDAVHAAMALPLRNNEIRDRVVAESGRRGVDGPSISSVRRAIGGWYRRQFDDALGVIAPPVDNMTVLLTRIHEFARTLEPLLPAAFDQVIATAFDTLEET